MKKIVKNFLKLLVTAGLLYYLFTKVPLKEVIDVITGAKPIYLLITFFLFFVYYLFFSIRWRKLLEAQDLNISAGFSYLYIHTSFFFNNFLPSGVGMDAVRSGYAGGKNNFEKAFGASLMERVLGMVGMMFLGLFAIFGSRTEFKQLSLIYFSFIILIGLLYYIAVRVKARKLKSSVGNIKFLNIGKFIRNFYRSIKIYKDRRKTVLLGLFYSVLVQFTIIVINFFIAKSLSIDIPFLALLAYIPFITIISLIPITVNGLGMREYAYVFFLTQIGVSKSSSLSMSILFFAISVIASSLGGIIFIFLKKPERKNKMPESKNI